jgi:phosphopantetheinyl transferase
MPRSTTSRSSWNSPEAGVAVHILRFEQRGPAAERAASRSAATMCVRRLLGTEALATTVEVERDERGVPWAVVHGNRISLSVSHADGWAAAAAHPRMRIGIDVEPAQELPPRFARYFLSPSEETTLAGWGDRPTSLLAAWTLKEASLKAVGRGLSVPPGTVRIRSIRSDGQARLTMDGEDLAARCWRDDRAVVAVACAAVSDLPPLLVTRGGS